MKKMSEFLGGPRLFSAIAVAAALVCGLGLFASGTAFAEDLSDNETCLECHADDRPLGALKVEGPEIHNDDGSFTVEDHEMWSCIDCHADIAEVPHKEGVERTVDCLACHDEVPAE